MGFVQEILLQKYVCREKGALILSKYLEHETTTFDWYQNQAMQLGQVVIYHLPGAIEVSRMTAFLNARGREKMRETKVVRCSVYKENLARACGFVCFDPIVYDVCTNDCVNLYFSEEGV